MKPSARVALIVALAATTAPTWASLPFYWPDYTFDSTTGTGFKIVFSGDINPEGNAASTMRYYDSDVALNYLIATWRGPTSLPTPQTDSDHINPTFGAINRYGWMCGRTERPTGGGTPAVWRSDGTRIDLPPIPSPFPDEPGSGYAFDMNDDGAVVGMAWNPLIGGGRPVYWTSSNEIVELANPTVLHDGWLGRANSINSNGIITGWVYNGGNIHHAVRWDINGTAPILSQTTDTGLTFTWTEAFKSSNDGTIVGKGIIGNYDYGILWTPAGEAIELRKLPNSTIQNIGISDINNNHYTIGSAQNSSGQRVAVRWSGTGEPFALNRLTDAPSNAGHTAYDINDFNFAVGVSWIISTYFRAILWTPDGDAIDLNALVELDTGWNFTSVSSISNTGWITGLGDFDPDGPAAAYNRPFSILVPFAGTYGMGDANFDESIDFADLLIVAQNYGTSTNGSFDVGDFNLDGSVNFTDLLAIAQNYGDVFSLLPNSPNPTFESDWQSARGMVPEPNLVGTLIGVGLTLRRRSKR